MQHAETKASEKSHHAGGPHMGKAAHDSRGNHDTKSHDKASESKAAVEAAAPMLEGAAQTMARSAAAAGDLLHDWQSLIQSSTDVLADHMMSTAADLKEFSDCSTPEDYGRATVAFHQSLAKRWLDTGSRFATLSAEYASRRLRLNLERAAPGTRQRRESH